MEKMPILEPLERITGDAVKNPQTVFKSEAEEKLAAIESLLKLDLELGGGARVYSARVPVPPATQGVSTLSQLCQDIRGQKAPTQAVGLVFACVMSGDEKTAKGMHFMRLDLYPMGAQSSPVEYSNYDSQQSARLKDGFEKQGVMSLSIPEAVDEMVKSHFKSVSMANFEKPTMSPKEFDEALTQRDHRVSQAMETLLPLVSKKTKEEILDPVASWNKPAPYELDEKGRACRTDGAFAKKKRELELQQIS